jgi:phosphoglycolate phosphatase
MTPDDSIAPALPASRKPSTVHDFKTIAAPTVVFDLDGTLVDTAPDLVATLNTIFAREGVQAVDYRRARMMIGGGSRLLIERGLEVSGRSFPASDIDRMVGEFIAYYAAHIADGSRPFPGVELALDELAKQGCILAVCTNKLEWLSVRLLETLGLAERFSAICGADTFGVRKPDPAILWGTIDRAGGDRGSAVMIGDSMTDVATARSAGIPVIAVDFGYTDVPVVRLDPDRVVSSFSGLPAAISELLGQKALLPDKNR